MISVIIPVYNVEKYLDKTVKSVLNQTYTDFELILVNDGSTDHSGQICDTYAALDNRVRVIHKENGGVSSARNVGLRVFKGNYLTFIDADDYIEPEYFETALLLFEEHKDADVIIFGLNIIEDEKSKNNKLKEYGLKTVNEYLKKAIQPSDIEYGGGYPVNKIWKVDKKKGIFFFDEELWSKEDRLWVFQMLLNVNNVWLDNRVFYNYVYNETSLTHAKGSVSRNRVNGIEAFKKISMLEYHNQELQNLSYISFCRLLVYRFCEGLLSKDIESIIKIYDLYKNEWIKIFKYMMFRHGDLKGKLEAIVCFVVGNILRLKLKNN